MIIIIIADYFSISLEEQRQTMKEPKWNKGNNPMEHWLQQLNEH
jgi:hypothetical protein